MEVVVQYMDGCPNWRTAEQRLQDLADELGLRVTRVRVSTPEEAAAVGFGGSPTILVDGRDPFAADTEPAGLACRVYQTPDGLKGSPTSDQLHVALAKLRTPGPQPARQTGGPG
jgi:hypothetical protein